jgi:hypothetical protein
MSETGNNMVKLERLPVRLVSVGGALLAICIVGGFRDGGEFFRSYLVAFLFWIGITLGCLDDPAPHGRELGSGDPQNS